ncbi:MULTISPECIES: tyrosine-type recombinase/integrase [unclassified Herbaspirillum]|uniref:tyrosine-type recombinase/integrase n=1 Tax=unclassified Herbaspirillum TaxID=2624150 RepID=UPI000E2E5C6F|nr:MULTISPECIES: tyrosine-type recombinase/integrase [unclassified Herbaspirillum]RFB67522.1 hypothetical protein DZB54_20380 [Herbaspirillum sp. 3R-3a1]TFI05127.1 hypothetical protein E4P32_23325 [Herbaspirillum sp. 3R11]TFI12543.1 hypothetical protein E4P31_21040 [Herbaspirillum sp. 3R-11]TFI26383.1 hypothetical protein E4P30_11845 [Herbaspirillum sp. 3C11]
MAFRLRLLSPSKTFKSEAEFRTLDAEGFLRDTPLALFNSPGVALVVDEVVHWNASFYLLENCLFGHSQTGDTVRTYGESLISYLNFLGEKNISLEDVTELVIYQYRNYLLSNNKKAPSVRTVNLRVSTASRFHQWGEERGQFSSPLGKRIVTESKPSQHFFNGRNQRRNTGITSFLPFAERRIPRVLTVAEIQLLFRTSPKPFSLIYKWAVVTGLRRFEICNLTVADLPIRSSEVTRNLREIRIQRKGGKDATVYAPDSLVDETWWYLIADRPKPIDGNEKYVFLGKNGKQFNRQYISSMFKRNVSTFSQDMTFHHLRHTFAVLTLTLLQRRAEQGDSINPLKTLQVLMGHSSIESTEIYLRALDIHSESVEEVLNYLYGSAVDGGMR